MHTQYNQTRLNQFRELNKNENESEDNQSCFSENQSSTSIKKLPSPKENHLAAKADQESDNEDEQHIMNNYLKEPEE